MAISVQTGLKAEARARKRRIRMRVHNRSVKVRPSRGIVRASRKSAV